MFRESYSQLLIKVMSLSSLFSSHSCQLHPWYGRKVSSLRRTNISAEVHEKKPLNHKFNDNVNAQETIGMISWVLTLFSVMQLSQIRKRYKFYSREVPHLWLWGLNNSIAVWNCACNSPSLIPSWPHWYTHNISFLFQEVIFPDTASCSQISIFCI